MNESNESYPRTRTRFCAQDEARSGALYVSFQNSERNSCVLTRLHEMLLRRKFVPTLFLFSTT
jgi:hypothetical protein